MAVTIELSWVNTHKHQEERSLSTHDERYGEFWQGLYNYMSNRKSAVAPPLPSDMNYVETPLRWRGFKLCAAFDSKGRKRKVELLITSVRHEDSARRLKAQRDDIEDEIGRGLDWNIKLTRKKKVSLWDCDVDVFVGPRSDQYAWYAEKLELFHSVFEPRIGQIVGS